MRKDDFVFQDDSAPIHRAKKVAKWKDENQIKSLPWVGNSPDLNPIENLWKILKLNIAQYKPSNLTELKRAVIKVWRTEISPELCKSLVNSMKRRCKAVIENSGGHIKY